MRRLALSLLPLLLLAAVGGGGFLLYGGWQDWRIYTSGDPEPQEIRAADLAANGPGDNVHVKVTDFTLGAGYTITQRWGKWTCVWIPLFPDGEKQEDVRVIVKTKDVVDEDEFRAFCRKKEVTGIV